MSRIAAAWRRYWFAPGGDIAIACVRVALGLAALGVVARATTTVPVAHPEAMALATYHPVGILQLFRAPPPRFVIALAQVVAMWGAAGMIVGVATRAMTIACTLGTLVVASQAMSFQPTWSHDLNVVLIALIAFVGARAGDSLGLDALVFRRGRPRAGYQWSLRLVQLAVALMFVSACYQKLRSGGLHWALSDNLRNQLLARFDLNGDTERGPFVDWVLAKSWRYEGLAVMNLISQSIPLAAVIFVRRPLVRALAGAAFVGEVIGLYHVTVLGNPSWFPLAAVFVDWDALWKFVVWLARRGRLPSTPAPVAEPVEPSDRSATPVEPVEMGERRPSAPVAKVPVASRGVSAFVIAFVVVDLVVSFVPRVDQVLRTYPFSRFPMFASMRVKQPYGEHQSYEFVGERLEIVTASGAAAPDWITRDYANRSLHRERDLGVLRSRLVAVRDDLQRRYPDAQIRGLRLWLTTYQVPAYPAPARLVPIDIGVYGEVEGDRWHTAFGTWPDDAAPLALFRGGLAVSGEPVARGAVPAGDMVHVVATLPSLDGTPRPFVIARRTPDYW